MIKHIVLWKLNDRSQAERMKAALEALPAKIPQIVLSAGGGLANPAAAGFRRRRGQIGSAAGGLWIAGIPGNEPR